MTALIIRKSEGAQMHVRPPRILITVAIVVGAMLGVFAAAFVIN